MKQAMAVSARALARSVRFMGEPMMIVILVDHTGWVRYTWREEGGERRVERGGWREEGGERRVERGGWRDGSGRAHITFIFTVHVYVHVPS